MEPWKASRWGWVGGFGRSGRSGDPGEDEVIVGEGGGARWDWAHRKKCGTREREGLGTEEGRDFLGAEIREVVGFLEEEEEKNEMEAKRRGRAQGSSLCNPTARYLDKESP